MHDFPLQPEKKKKMGKWKAKSGKLESHDIFLLCFGLISLIYAASIAHDVKSLES